MHMLSTKKSCFIFSECDYCIRMRLLVVSHLPPAIAALLLTAVITNREVRGQVTNTISGEYETFISDIKEFTDEVSWGVATNMKRKLGSSFIYDNDRAEQLKSEDTYEGSPIMIVQI